MEPAPTLDPAALSALADPSGEVLMHRQPAFVQLAAVPFAEPPADRIAYGDDE